MNQGELLGSRRCPVCKGFLEVVHNGQSSWRISCFKNDIFTEDAPPLCEFDDVYGATQESAVSNFDAQRVSES